MRAHNMPRGQTEQLTPAICLSTHLSLHCLTVFSLTMACSLFFAFFCTSVWCRTQKQTLFHHAGEKQDPLTACTVGTDVSSGSPAITEFCFASSFNNPGPRSQFNNACVVISLSRFSFTAEWWAKVLDASWPVLSFFYPDIFHESMTWKQQRVNTKAVPSCTRHRFVIKCPSLWIGALLLNCTQNGLLFQQITHSLAYSSHEGATSFISQYWLHTSSPCLARLVVVFGTVINPETLWINQTVESTLIFIHIHLILASSPWSWREYQSRKVGSSHLGNRL